MNYDLAFLPEWEDALTQAGFEPNHTGASWKRKTSYARDSGYGQFRKLEPYCHWLQEYSGKWWASYSTETAMPIWRSPGFSDPVAALVYAEVEQWGR